MKHSAARRVSMVSGIAAGVAVVLLGQGAAFAGNSPPQPLPYTVPANTCWVEFTLGGAAGLGREAGGFVFDGGKGAMVGGRLQVVAGDQLLATLGAQGGATAINANSPLAAPGGSKSVITRNGIAMVVAGGGGGASFAQSQIIGNNVVETTIDGEPASFQAWIYETKTGPGGDGGAPAPSLSATASNTAGSQTVVADVTATAGIDPDLASLVQISPAGHQESTIDVKLSGGGPGEGQPNGAPGGAKIRNQFGEYSQAAVAAAVTGGQGGSNWFSPTAVSNVTTGANPTPDGMASFTPVACPPPQVDDTGDLPETGSALDGLVVAGFAMVFAGATVLAVRRRRPTSVRC